MYAVNPDFLLFMQHGWADDNQQMLDLGRRLVGETVPVIAPNLGYVQTWLRIAPLIQMVESESSALLSSYPDATLRIVGHSMGGLIWLEVLHRHPDWWARIHSLVLVASPVGGADLGRMIDPLGIGIGIAADLGVNRRPIAEQIATQIPTLVIAGDVDEGSDGTITVESTKVPHARFVRLPDLDHATLRTHVELVPVIQDFWNGSDIGEPLTIDPVIQKLRAVPGITDAHRRDFVRASVFMTLDDGSTIRIWKNPLEVYHVFVASADGECRYAGFVGWLHTADLWAALNELQAAH
jgi:hypothetical protein